MTLDEKLAAIDSQYDAACAMFGVEWSGGPGYHSHVAAGMHVHALRNNFEYAVFLLRSSEAAHHSRAADVLRACLRFQETDPMRKDYGIWPWLAEEPLDQMAPPDWNWADFCGAAIAVILTEAPERLPGGLRGDLQAALGHAAMAIFRRNVQPGYTNICVMGAGVCAAAGEILDNALLLAYGRRRLEAFVAHTRFHGGLNEYNSPTYTFVALHECERILQVVQDPGTREAAETLRRMIWQFLAERYHPGTQQLAGPHSRAYADLLRAEATAELQRLTAPGAANDTTFDQRTDVVSHLPCPAELRERFQRLPEPEVCLRSRFIRHADDAHSTYGTTWLCDDAALGTINHGCLWIQRRSVLGYVVAPQRPAVLKVQFLRDFRPCASAATRSAQDRNRVLSAFQLLTNKGDHHIHLDRPEDGVFTASDLRLRYRLDHPTATLGKADARHAVLVCGDWEARLWMLPVSLGAESGRWETGSDDDGIFADAVLYHGRERGIPFADPSMGIRAGAGLQLSRRSERPSGSEPEATEADGLIQYRWGDLQVSMPKTTYAL